MTEPACHGHDPGHTGSHDRDRCTGKPPSEPGPLPRPPAGGRCGRVTVTVTVMSLTGWHRDHWARLGFSESRRALRRRSRFKYPGRPGHGTQAGKHRDFRVTVTAWGG